MGLGEASGTWALASARMNEGIQRMGRENNRERHDEEKERQEGDSAKNTCYMLAMPRQQENSNKVV